MLLRLEVVEWLLNRMVAAAALGVVIIFQPELRRVFAEIGSTQSRLRNTSRERQQRITTIIDSVVFLASHRVGALIAVERDIGMRGIAETGTPIRAPLTQQLLTTFFFPDTPLHDGGVLIKGGMILAAGCIFPLTDDPDFARSLGTRHRAAVGLSEETDAIVLVVGGVGSDQPGIQRKIGAWPEPAAAGAAFADPPGAQSAPERESSGRSVSIHGGRSQGGIAGCDSGVDYRTRSI